MRFPAASRRLDAAIHLYPTHELIVKISATRDFNSFHHFDPCMTHFPRLSSRLYSASTHELPRIRNIGIIAHIDAGKTTTTERMLYYSGFTRRIGEVDRGDTVMDYLPEERERGITISSAAITFPWRGHQINLIDTPGHVDFTFEVERSLRVLDGAVAILDARAGVQAQTKTVWNQACRYKVPKIVYVNKLDKIGADFERCIQDIETKLGVSAVALQKPIIDSAGKIGLVDLTKRKLLRWSDSGESITLENAAVDADVQNLCEKLATLDEGFLNEYLEDQNISSERLTKSICELTRSGAIVPVLCGSSFKNIGVQPLLDAVVDYLPPPLPPASKELCMLAFKCVFDPQKGFLVFVRVYSGEYQAKTPLFNSTLGLQERPVKLMQVFADRFEEVRELRAGNIGVLIGLNGTRTGDVLLSPYTKNKSSSIQMEAMKIPPAVFFCSIEPESASDEAKLESVLQTILREDPSVQVINDKETGQTLLAGIGELHLEIVQNRITRDFKVAAHFGKVQIGYRETPVELLERRLHYDREVNGTKLTADIKLSIEPSELDANLIVVDMTEFNSDEIASVKETLQGALMCSPLSRYPVSNAKLYLIVESLRESTSVAAVCHAVNSLFRSMLTDSPSSLRRIEPIMSLQIECPADYVGHILNDLNSKRRGTVHLVSGETSEQVIEAEAPLAELLGYASWLRSASQGHASCTMRPAGFSDALLCLVGLIAKEGDDLELDEGGLASIVHSHAVMHKTLEGDVNALENYRAHYASTHPEVDQRSLNNAKIISNLLSFADSNRCKQSAGMPHALMARLPKT